MTPLEQMERGTRLHDVVRACERVAEAVADASFNDYVEDWKLRAVIERQFITIGEALRAAMRAEPDVARNLTSATQIVNFRNQLVHNYAHIDDEVVWNIITDHLPRLHAEVRALLP